jgi:hypothetical protein
MIEIISRDGETLLVKVVLVSEDDEDGFSESLAHTRAGPEQNEFVVLPIAQVGVAVGVERVRARESYSRNPQVQCA